MSLTLKSQMETIFLQGLEVVKLHKNSILHEWNELLTLLQKTERMEKNAEDTVLFFNDFLFNQQLEGKAFINKLESIWDENDPIKTNQFILTLLENAVHKVIQSNEKFSHHDHQAIQYLFTIIGEHLLSHPYHKHFSLDTFLNHLVSSQQLPIEWVAIANNQRKTYYVEKWINNMNHNLLLDNDNLKADTLYSLSDLLLSQMPDEKRKGYTIIPIPYEEVTLLICTNKEDSSQMIPFITYALRIFQKGNETLKQTRQDTLWKDSVIMFNEIIMRSQTYDDALQNITAGFVNYLPFERCALFSYSYNEQMGFGLFGHRLDNEAIQNITEDISNLPIIKNNLQVLQMFGKNINYLQPLYVEDASAGFPIQYVKQFQLKSVVIVPIFTSSTNKLLGAAILDQGPNNHFKVSKDTFTALIKFGQSAGEILAKFYPEDSHHVKAQKTETIHFSPREVEVLKLMAEGASTNEAASELNLSEYTVRDYVSAIMQKMEARNRTEAVARAIRDGII